MVTILSDLTRCFDAVPWGAVLAGAISLRFPLSLIRRAVVSYGWSRHVGADGLVGPPLYPSRGIDAGAAAAVFELDLALAPTLTRVALLPHEFCCRRAHGRDPRRPGSRADASPRGRGHAARGVVDGAGGALRSPHRASRDRRRAAGIARAARRSVDGRRRARRASRCRARGASGNRAPRADAPPRTAARRSGRSSVRDRCAEAADTAHARGVGRRAQEAAWHRRDGR